MGPLAIAQLIFGLVSSAPAMTQTIQNALSDHWGKDHVEQAKHGISVLGQIIDELEQGMIGGSVPPTPSPQMGTLVPPTATGAGSLVS